MKKTKIDINMDNFPKKLRPYLADSLIYDSSSFSGAKVYYISPDYYLKVDEPGKLRQEAYMAEWFYGKGLGVEVVWYLSEDKDYLLTKSAKGEDCISCLENPEQLCQILAKTLRRLHSMPISDVPVSKKMGDFLASAGDYNGGDYDEWVRMPRFMVHSRDEAWAIMQENKHRLKCDVLIHGDLCLPNMILDGGEFSCFIDLGLAGAGDRHIDLYWMVWSLQYNLKTDGYTDYFLDLYGRENFEYDMLKVVAAFELFG